MICSCCGLKIIGKYHKIENGFICKRCWNDPNLFFPEKFKESENWDKILDIVSIKDDDVKVIELPVLKLKQKDVVLYTGKLKAKDLVKLYAVFILEENSLIGYQRELYEDKVKDLYDYLINFPVAIMPGLIISVREKLKFYPIENNFTIYNNDLGHISIPLSKGSLWVIDGQHRISVFEKIIGRIGDFYTGDEANQEYFLTLMDYEFPVTFIDSQDAIRHLNQKDVKLTPEDIERAIFYIINKTQRSISPSLKDTLQYSIKRSGLSGIPAIEKEPWRTEATAVAIDMNALDYSPFYKKINLSGRRGLNRPIQLNSFVSSLKPLYKNDIFSQLSHYDKKIFLLNYWKSILNNNRSAFSSNKYRNYLILKALGVYTLHLIIIDYINYCIQNKRSFMVVKNIRKFVNAFKDFNWAKKESSIANFGGMGGVREARIILIDHLSRKLEDFPNQEK